MMAAARKHDRRLGLIGASLTKARLNRLTMPVLGEVQDELERLIDNHCFLGDAPFDWVTVALRFGLKNQDSPHYMKINKKYGDLPLGIELDTHELLDADRETLKRLFTIATLKALIHAGRKYNLPTEALEARQAELATETARAGDP